MVESKEPASVSRFRKYLQIKSVHPTPDYESCREFLIDQAKEIGLEYQIVECVRGKPIIILKLAGSDPRKKSISLSSHTDVVPVAEEKWKYNPFGAERVQDDNGDYRIYARGSQDMKVTGSCYLEALRLIKGSGIQLTRNVYAIYAPDEEIGGADGVGSLVKTQEFKNLNIGFDVDESVPSPTDTSFLFVGQKYKCPEKWKHNPFGAERVQDDNGDYRIYARGSQDMKVTGSCYLEALRLIKGSGIQLTRNVYAIYAPDEEIGGADGVGSLVKTQEFKNLNIGFDVDESVPSPTDTSFLFVGQKYKCPVKFVTHGNSGHGSMLMGGTAFEKLRPIINTLMDLRDGELAKLITMGAENVKSHGRVNTINLTVIETGTQQNVVPAACSALFDIAIEPGTNVAEFKQMLRDLAAKHDAELHFLYSELEENPVTQWDTSDKYISVLESTFKKHNIKHEAVICPSGTDAKYMRYNGIPAIGVCPLLNHPTLVHDHDEFAKESEFLKGIDFYVDLIKGLANA
ncbi:Aminoacylase-1 [Zancudomyces culisetae]|uniref:Aminoacylase-1 n=1 Tax=Zancudomyces culisetae TaxID=1213189 RepID=A0A1R1PVW3_ZANCU|nr:Aminoacylase-1 [Zancudomyces culisetae]|eukprot:OMH85084.1 Aminoacylase-1 [Zancudomyces culisetae]